MKKNGKPELAVVMILLYCLSLPTFAKAPTVIKATPDNGEKNVDPSANEITIHFDQAMSTGSYSICGGGPNFPKTIGKAKWVGNDTVVLKVQLEPNHKYELSVNCPSYQNFKSRNGEPAIIYPITFETGSVGSSSGGKFSNKTIISKLHEAIYAEETEGDLDRAIELYQQVIDQAGEVERIAAKAAYKLGMCYLKKDDKESAAKYFQSVVEKYPSQLAYINQAKQQLEKIEPVENELPLFAQVPSDILEYISGQYAVLTAESKIKNLKFNNHIYYVSPELKLFWGGYGYYQQPANSSTPKRIRVGGTTYPDQSFYDVIGNKMEIEIEDRPGQPGYYDIYWKPTVEIPAGQPFYYGWCRNKSKQLNPIDNTNAYPVTMQNQYGSPVLEVFFLVLPEGFAVVEQSEDFTQKETVAGFDIYQWKKEVPTSTNHTVNITLNYDQAKKRVFEGNVFDILGTVVCSYIGSKYGEICAEAGMNKLYSNSHIYLLDDNFVLRMGGMGYTYNWTDKPITEKYRISGAKKTNLKYYDIMDNEMDIEIVPDEQRNGFYNVYWNPKEPLEPGGFLHYGWILEDNIQLSKNIDGTGYGLTMDNRFVDHCYETFFLVVPEGTALVSKSEEYTKMKNLQGWDIYWWKKEVPANTDHTVNVTLKKETFADKIQVYKVDKSVADFAADDFSTPESAYAAINRVSASGKAEGWKKASVPSLADRLPGKDSSVPEDWAEVLRNAKIVEVRIYDNKYAQVTAELLNEYSTKEIKQPFDIRHLELVDGKWLNTGNDRRNSVEETVELFEKVVQRKTNKQEEVGLNPFNNSNQPYAIWFRPTNISVKDGKGLLELFNSIINFGVETYKFRTETKGQGIIGSICTDGENGKDKIVNLLNKSKEVKFIKTTTPYVISFKANDPKDAASDKDLLNTFNKCHPDEVETHHFRTTNQQDQLIGHICTDTIREKNAIVNAIEKSGTMVLVGTTEPLEKQESIKPETCLEDENKAKIEAAVKSASAWLEMFDNGSYDQSWEEAASLFKAAVAQSQWQSTAKAVREPLGKLISREVMTKNYTQQVPGGPDGQYVIITFKSSFENKKDAIETVTPMLDNDGKWKVSGYYIK